ncbi:MAG TPA: cation diffusion facilitator family transporter [Methylophilaceae bacterium]|nr:cation diffusion facilitator family transporter [Methylophilaceae bacterium]
MASCCEDKSCEITGLREKHSRVLKIVLLVNALMFLVEAIFGWLSHSTALLADSLDMLGDALVYGMSLYVLAGTQRQQAKVALAKSGFMLLFGLFVLGEAAYKMAFPVLPDAQTMGIVGAIALAANLLCFALLYRHRADNLNMSSTWLCSRNDLMANVSVLAAAALGHWLRSGWPDIVVGTCIALLFLQSAYVVLLQALRQMKAPPPAAPVAIHRK